MTQKERILNYIREFGSISQKEAFLDLGITKLSTRVSEMSRDGIQFHREMEKGKNRWGEPTSYMRYSLEEKDG